MNCGGAILTHNDSHRKLTKVAIFPTLSLASRSGYFIKGLASFASPERDE